MIVDLELLQCLHTFLQQLKLMFDLRHINFVRYYQSKNF